MNETQLTGEPSSGMPDAAAGPRVPPGARPGRLPQGHRAGPGQPSEIAPRLSLTVSVSW